MTIIKAAIITVTIELEPELLEAMFEDSGFDYNEESLADNDEIHDVIAQELETEGFTKFLKREDIKPFDVKIEDREI